MARLILNRIGLFGTAGLLLLVQLWVNGHLSSDHHHQLFGHHHQVELGTKGPIEKQDGHQERDFHYHQRHVHHHGGGKDPQDDHGVSDHKIWLVHLKTMPCLKYHQALDLCSGFAIHEPGRDQASWSSGPDEPPPQTSARRYFHTRAPPLFFLS